MPRPVTVSKEGLEEDHRTTVFARHMAHGLARYEGSAPERQKVATFLDGATRY